MHVHIYDEQQDFKIVTSTLSRCVHLVLGEENIECDEISIYFVSSKEISRLHAEFFDDPTPTDCITFPIDEEGGYLGDVFVCPQVALEYSNEHKVGMSEELTRYVVHGLLHLCGFDDLDEADYQNMKEKEAHYLKKLSSENLLLGIQS